MRLVSAAAFVLFFVASNTRLPAQSVIVVDDDGSAPFTEIQPAIDAASSGDTILVKAGSYSSSDPITIRAKALSVIGDEKGSAFLNARLVVEDLAPTDAVFIRRLHVPASSLSAFGILVQNCAGAVVIEDSSILGKALEWNEGMVITDSAAVTVARCTVRARDRGIPRTDGIELVRSSLYAFDTSIEGGDGTFALGQPLPAGAGLHIEDAFAYLQGCSVRGGTGASWLQLGCQPGGTGGPGVTMSGAQSRLEHLDTTIRGGSGGIAFPPCSSGGPGPATLISGGTVNVLPGSALSLAANSPARERETLTFHITGQAGHPAWLVLGLPSVPAFFRAFGGPLLLDSSILIVVPAGVIPTSGSLVVATRVPLLLPGTEVTTLSAQAFSADPAAGLRAGSGQTLTLLDESF